MLASLFFEEKDSNYCDSLAHIGLITQKPFKMFNQDQVHMFLGTKHISTTSQKTVALIIVNNAPFHLKKTNKAMALALLCSRVRIH